MTRSNTGFQGRRPWRQPDLTDHTPKENPEEQRRLQTDRMLTAAAHELREANRTYGDPFGYDDDPAWY